MEQLLIHLWGDYLTQSDWMANNKTSKTFPCISHALIYGLPFLLLTFSPLALLVIIGTHFLLDRFRLAKYVVWAKNFLAPPQSLFEKEQNGCNHSANCNCSYAVNAKFAWENCKATGYPSETPPFLAVWLMIIADNTLHLTINYFALKYL